jgi:hypothetical protein
MLRNCCEAVRHKGEIADASSCNEDAVLVANVTMVVGNMCTRAVPTAAVATWLEGVLHGPRGGGLKRGRRDGGVTFCGRADYD